LLVVDNCEHVKEAAARLIGRLIGAAPGVRILATSREPLGVAGEQVWPVGPFSVVGDSVELFCDRAALSDPAFELDDTGRVLVERICV
jgi:predicted ATPase